MKDNNSFKRNTLLLTIGTIVNKGLQFLAIPVFSRWMTTAEFGQYDLLYSYILLIVPFITLATQESIFRMSVDENEMQKKTNITNALYLVTTNYFLVATIIVCFWTSYSQAVLIAFLFYIFAEVYATYLRGFLRAIKRLDIYSYSMMIGNVYMLALVTVFVKYLNWGVFGIILGYGLASFCSDITIAIWSKWLSFIKHSTVNLSVWKSLLKYSLPLFPNDISWWIMSSSDRQIINIFFNDAANGIYAIAHKIPALCSVVFNMFSVSWQQEIIEKIESEERTAYINSVFEKYIVILLSFCSGLLASGFVLYYFIFDIKYFEANMYSPILILSTIFTAISQYFGGIQIALKKPKQNGITTIVGAMCNIFIHIMLIPYIGLYAASISTLISNIIIVIFRMVLIGETYKVVLTKKMVISIVLCIYFFIMSYINANMIINFMNLVLAGSLFIVQNRKLLSNLVNRRC